MFVRNLFAAAMIVGFTGAAAWAGAPESAQVGQAAPDFTLKSSDGKDVKLSEFKGKVVVLEWTNHECPFVKRHCATAKTMQNTFAKFTGKNVAWLQMDSNHFCVEKKDSINEFRKTNNITYPTLLDADGKVGHLYGAKTTPHMFVIDAKGLVVYMGAIDDDAQGNKTGARNYVFEAVEAALNNSTVPVAKTESYGCSVKYKQ